MRRIAVVVALAALAALLGRRRVGRDRPYRRGFAVGTDDFGYDPGIDPDSDLD
jgi:hypothetical protein